VKRVAELLGAALKSALFMSRRIFCSAFLLFAFSAFGQSASNSVHGTILIVAFRHNHIVAAVDSKLLNAKNPIACKMVELGKYGFFVSNGLGGVPDEFFAPDVAKEVFKTPKIDPASARKDGVADAWGRSMAYRFNHSRRVTQQDLEESRMFKTSGIFGFGDFLGRLYLFEVHLNIVGEKGKRRITYVVEQHFDDDSKEIEYGPTHSMAQMHEQMAGASPRARAFNQTHPVGPSDHDYDARVAARTLDALIQWNPQADSISAPVDAVTLDPGQPLRWVRRKPQCRDSN
jgi:hypothetical protein